MNVISQGKNDTFKMLRSLKEGHCLNIIGDLNIAKSNTFVVSKIREPFFGNFLMVSYFKRCYNSEYKKKKSSKQYVSEF